MKWERMKIALVLVFFVLVVAASLVFPALGLAWQDRKMENQVEFETTEEVVLRREDIFSLEEKIRLFSGYDADTQIARIDLNKSEEDEREEAMNRVLYEECEKLYQMGLLPDYPVGVEFSQVEYWDRSNFFVFDRNNPSKSMIVWTYLIDLDGGNACASLHLEQESKKILGFSYWRWNYDLDSYHYPEITEEKVLAFADYLGYEVQDVIPEVTDYIQQTEVSIWVEDSQAYTDSQREEWEKNQEAAFAEAVESSIEEFGVDAWGNRWREVYQVKMGKTKESPDSEAESESWIDYLVKVSEVGFSFGEETIFY